MFNNIYIFIDFLVEDENIYTPTLPLNSSKDDDKIPKVLMPMKMNKTKNSSHSPTSNSNKENKEEKQKESYLKVHDVTDDVITNNSKTKKSEENEVNFSDITENKITFIKNDPLIQKEDDDDDCLIIKNIPSKTKQQEKLAPLFKKKIKPSAETMEARRLFLQSDIKKNISNKEINKKPVCLGMPMLPFPKVSHVNQISLNSHDSDEEIIQFNFKNSKIIPRYNISHIKFVTKSKDTKKISKYSFECVKTEIDLVLSEIETYFTNASSLWKSISTIKKSENLKKSLRERNHRSDKNNLKKTNKDLQNKLLNSLWIDKYKPTTSSEVIGNEEAVKKLKSWLERWESVKNIEYSSGEEFYNSDCSASSNFISNQVVVLIGPHGSGKTASTYAVAQELGYK